MGRKLPTTPRSRVKNALRQLWLRSRERAACLKAHKHSCARCGIKSSVAKGKEVKLQVHHKEGIGNWEEVIDLIYEQILCAPEKQEPLCTSCHLDAHNHDKDTACHGKEHSQ